MNIGSPAETQSETEICVIEANPDVTGTGVSFPLPRSLLKVLRFTNST